MNNWIGALPLILTNEMAGFNVTPNKMLSGSAIGSISKQSSFKCSDITICDPQKLTRRKITMSSQMYKLKYYWWLPKRMDIHKDEYQLESQDLNLSFFHFWEFESFFFYPDKSYIKFVYWVLFSFSATTSHYTSLIMLK